MRKLVLLFMVALATASVQAQDSTLVDFRALAGESIGTFNMWLQNPSNLRDYKMPALVTRSMYWDAGAMTPDGTNCAAPTEQDINSGPKTWAFSCADNNSSIFYGKTVMPDKWDAGTLTFELWVFHGTTETITFAGDFSAQCRGETEIPSSTWGTPVAADVSITTANQIVNATSGAVTPEGTCAAGDYLFWRYVVDSANFSTNAANAKVMGVKVEYGRTLDSD